MKNRIIKSIFILFFFCLNFFSLFAQSENTLKGIELSDSVYNLLKSTDLHPYTQSLVTSVENTFPYNILVNIPSSQKTDTNLLLIFFQEDINENKQIFNKTLHNLQKQTFDFNLILLFAYEPKQKIEHDGMIFGTEVYLQTINTNEDFTAIVFDLSETANSIQTSSSGYTSPSWLIRNEYNIFKKEKVKSSLPTYYISHLNNLDIFQNTELNLLFSNNIPAIKLCFSKTENNSATISNVIEKSIESFASTENRIWDYHFLMINIFGHLYRLSESTIIKIIILIAFCWLSFICIFIFINMQNKNRNWHFIKNIWYSIPVTFILILIPILIIRPILSNFSAINSDYQSIFTLFSLIFIISFFLCSAYYLITLLYNFKFEEKTIDFLLVICTFINQSLFILVDISLFPIFMFICLLSIISLLIKNNKIHFCIFILMIIPFIPYVHNVIHFTDPALLKKYLLTNKFFPISVSFVLYPIYLLYFRLLTYIRVHSKTNTSITIFSGVFFLTLSIFIIIIALVNINKQTKQVQKADLYTVSPSSKYSVEIKHDDKLVFTDTIRTLNIECSDYPEFCNITLYSEEGSPILYTDDEYEQTSPTSAYFKIPDNPPKNMTFSYCAAKYDSKITVLLCFKNKDKENDYSFVTKTITIGE